MKRQHPIRKTWKAMAKAWTQPKQEAIIARHVKPLLDALWADHEICREGVAQGDPDDCKTCKMVAEWRAKL